MDEKLGEALIWAAAGGGVITLCLVVGLDFARHRSKASLQLMVYMLVFGACALLMGGLPGPLWPGWEGRSLHIAQALAGPFAATLAIALLRVWVGAGNRDRMTYSALTFGVVVMTAGLAALLILAIRWTEQEMQGFFHAAALLSAGAIVLGTLASSRAAVLGDRLAWRMVLGCVLAALVTGALNAKLLGMGLCGWPLRLLTAGGVLLYLIVIAWTVMQRGAQYRRLKMRPGTATEMDALTHLPVGASLLARIDEGLRRSARFQRDCAVVAVSIDNLGELGSHGGHELRNGAALTLASRIRAKVGPRDVVGMYHPGCFIVVVAAMQSPANVRKLGLRLAASLREPMALTGMTFETCVFKPDVGVGVIRMAAGKGDSSLALGEAETVAKYARRVRSRAAICSLWGDDLFPLETYDFKVRTDVTEGETLPGWSQR